MGLANGITGIRFLVSGILLFCPVFSPAFYGFYLLAGATDVLDGVVARKTNTVSESGSRLDTAADLVFAAVCLVKLLPVLEPPRWLLLWIFVIAVIKGIHILLGFLREKKLLAVHSPLNKAVGVLLFLLPLTLPVADIRYSGGILCLMATLAAVQEGVILRRRSGAEGCSGWEEPSSGTIRKTLSRLTVSRRGKGGERENSIKSMERH